MRKSWINVHIADYFEQIIFKFKILAYNISRNCNHGSAVTVFLKQIYVYFIQESFQFDTGNTRWIC